MRLLPGFLFFIFLSPVCARAQKSWHYGFYYSFGAAFNVHQSNPEMLRPRDVSSLGFITRLDNEGKSLGLQAGLGLRWYDVRHSVVDNYYIDNAFRSLEARLQITMPFTKRSRIALGFAPRFVFRDRFSMVYESSVNGSHSEVRLEMYKDHTDLRELNASLIATWQYQLHTRWFLHISVEQDVMTTYVDDVIFENYNPTSTDEPDLKLNSILTSALGSIVFLVR